MRLQFFNSAVIANSKLDYSQIVLSLKARRQKKLRTNLGKMKIFQNIPDRYIGLNYKTNTITR